MKFKYDPKVIRKHLDESKASPKEFAARCKVSVPTLYAALRGEAGSGAAAKIINYINLNPVKKPERGVAAEQVKLVATAAKPEPAMAEPAASGDTLKWLQDVIASGKVSKVEIRVEVSGS